MDKKIEEAEITIFDTETTGLDPDSGDRVVEIAAIRIKGKEKIASFQTLINPEKAISEAAFGVNHITPEMLEKAPRPEEALPKFLNFIQDSCLCSYNAGFDLEFLNNELRLLNKTGLESMVVIDILKMAKKLLPGLERYALWYVAQSLGIKKQQEHRALSDVELTLDVFDKFKKMLELKGIFDFSNFSGLFGVNAHFLDNLNNHKIAKIQEAINLGVKLRIKYLASSNAEVTQREVTPKEIRQDKKVSYLVGYCALRNDERTFRVDNILHLEIL